MHHNIDELVGLVFVHPQTSDEYGPIRACDSANGHPAARDGWVPVAEDSCGNAFVASQDGRVAFWDHETDALVQLAKNWKTFSFGCSVETPVEIDPSQVESVWIDPDFAKEHGIDVPPDGWKKKP